MAAEQIGGGRPVRPCVACGQHDDHPRDQVDLGGGETAYYHIDCHALMGCESCKWQADAAAGATGQGMLDAIISLHEQASEQAAG